MIVLGGRRAMLNYPGHHSTAAIVAELVETKYDVEPMLQISDCSRVISLALCNPREAADVDFENDMHKLDVIVDCVNELRKAMRRERKKALRGS